MIEIDKGPKAIGVAANNGKHKRQIVMRRANDGFRTAADADPGLERSAFDWWKYGLLGKGRARLSSPGDRLVPQECRKQIEFIIKQRFVIR
jgi:hypothetical protein